MAEVILLERLRGHWTAVDPVTGNVHVFADSMLVEVAQGRADRLDDELVRAICHALLNTVSEGE